MDTNAKSHSKNSHSTLHSYGLKNLGSVWKSTCTSSRRPQPCLRAEKVDMESKTCKLLQQAGKFVFLDKPKLAIEQYLKVHELEPEETFVIDTLGDLYLRIGDEQTALRWYWKLAEIFESRDLVPNAIAAYKKILRLIPQHEKILTRMAALYEQLGDAVSAKRYYGMIARQLVEDGKHDEALAIYHKICGLGMR